MILTQVRGFVKEIACEVKGEQEMTEISVFAKEGTDFHDFPCLFRKQRPYVRNHTEYRFLPAGYGIDNSGNAVFLKNLFDEAPCNCPSQVKVEFTFRHLLK